MIKKQKKKDFSKKRMTFESFKSMAKDPQLSNYEKIGFPNSYREHFEEDIFQNIATQLRLNRKGISLLDIGCGCSGLPINIINFAELNDINLFMLDSDEMLANLPDRNYVKISCKFPNGFPFDEHRNGFDTILIYSVLQHVIFSMNPFSFIDEAVQLLKPSGRLLLGDIPNISKRNRFFASESGHEYHKNFTGDESEPEYSFNQLIKEKVDDSLVFSILTRYRNAGYETYLVEQPSGLPMSNRREDILIVRN